MKKQPHITLLLVIIALIICHACTANRSRVNLESPKVPALLSGQVLIYSLTPGHSPIAKANFPPCPGQVWCFKNYVLPNPQWGYPPDTNAHVHTLTYPYSTNVVLQYGGFFGDAGCVKSNSISIPDPAPSPKYRFTVWFTTTNNLPTGTNDPLVADGMIIP